MLKAVISSSSRFVISKCEVGVIGEVMAFFRRKLDSAHVLATSRKFVDWQFLNATDATYNFILGRGAGNGELLGVLGYIPNTFFDNTIEPKDKFCWITNWLVVPDGANGLGLELLAALSKHESCNALGTVGNNEHASAIYKSLKYQVGYLSQFFLVNRFVDATKIITNYAAERFDDERSSNVKLVLLNSLDELPISGELSDFIRSARPYKSISYFRNKYLFNPFYKYFAYGLCKENQVYGLLFGRVLTHENVNVIRLVEYAGYSAHLSGLYNELQGILKALDAEYMDFYQHGVSADILHSSGFRVNNGADNPAGLIVPNYFEPFQNKNVAMAYAYRLSDDGLCHIYKGDCDREHPRGLTE